MKTSKKNLTYEVIRSGQTDFFANQTLIMGEKDAVLIDVPLTLSQAHRVVASIIESGKNLTHIFVTHAHPDHYFSASVLLDAFPNAKFIAAPKVAHNVGSIATGRTIVWSAVLGTNAPRNIIIPNPYEKNYIDLEGHKLEILDIHAGDHPECSAIYIPSLNAIIAGDTVFNGFHLFMTHGKEEYRKEWQKTMEYLISLKPEIVVPGHTAPGLSDGPESLKFVQDYLVAYEEAASQAETSEDLVAAMKNKFPDVLDLMDDFVVSLSAKVASGEMEPMLDTNGMEAYL